MLATVVNGLAILLLAGESLMVLVFSTVYVGAIAILFLFVAIFITPESPRLRFVPLLPAVGFTLIFLFFSLEPILSLFHSPRLPLDLSANYVDFLDFLGSTSPLYQFGVLLFTQYFVSTLLVSLVLFSSMVGAIALALPPVSPGSLPSP
jgi:NADH:ubiquinone oxidoreductase subunit 6 (subunit J)